MLQTRTIAPATLEILKILMSIKKLNQFYLVGGTAIALQLGHRESIDLDLFTIRPFSNTIILNSLPKKFFVKTLVEEPNVLMLEINDVKVDFIKMSYPILFPTIEIEKVRMLGLKDIAPMKLKAIAQRGSKKDFYEIYYLLNEMSLTSIFENFKSKFNLQDIFHIIKSLMYFDDAMATPTPITYDKIITWEKVKSTILKESLKFNSNFP